MPPTQLDVLHVRTTTEREGARIVVDLDDDINTDRFIAITSDGALLCLGLERVHLNWEALDQLVELLTVSRKKLKVRR